jgi:hypothetical protein
MYELFTIVRVIDLSSPTYGALVVFAHELREGDTTTISAMNEKGEKGQMYYAQVNEYDANNGRTTTYAAVFPRLPMGNYGVYKPGEIPSSYRDKKITIFPGVVVEVDYT